MLKALIVDDDKNVSRCLRQLIDWKSLGYQVLDDAYDGETAYKLAVRENPDVIISDIKMPYMDGTELCKKIRTELVNVSIVFLSAYEDFSAAQIALKYGVKDYILKPINMQKINAISEILRELEQGIEQRKIIDNLLSSNDTEVDLFNRLKQNDTTYFTHLFEMLLNGNSNNFAPVRTLCVKLINTLYDNLQSIGVDEQILDNKRKNVEKDLEELKMIKDLVFYTRKLYFDVLQFENKSKEDYYIALINDIKTYICENYSEESLNVSHVAEWFKFSQDYFGKLFKQYTGMSVNSFITNVRMEKAMELLKKTMLPISDIAAMTGYASSGYFAKTFKAKENITPSEYRIKMQSIQSNYIKEG